MKRWLDLGKGLGGAGNFVASTTTKGIHYISEALMWVGGGFLILIALLTVSDISGRALFNIPVQGAIETVELTLVLVVFSAMVYTTTRQANVRVTVLVSRFPERTQNILALIMIFIGVVLFAIVSWQLGLSAAEWTLFNRHSATLGIPVAPIKFAAAVAAGIISLVLLINFFNSLGKQR